MKNLVIALFILPSTVSAQEYWGNDQLIWQDPSGLGQHFDPCFAQNPNQILISMEWFSDFKRIYLVTGEWQSELFFPDSIGADGHDDTPFMTQDGNGVYFSSNRPGGQGGFDIWYTENTGYGWTMPVNLGPNINSELDEISPTLVPDSSEMFFIRGNYDAYSPISDGAIIRSQYSGGEWQTAVELPESINSAFDEYSPAISGDGSKLYFISHRNNGLPGLSAVWVSERTGDEWGEPYMPEGFINQYYQDCPPWWDWYGAPVSVCVSADNGRIVFVKVHHFLCFEANSLVYIAERTTGVKNPELEYPGSIQLSIHPNPFNSSLIIQTSGSSDGSLAIYDILGREIINYGEMHSANVVTWNGRNRFGDSCPSGIYFVRFKSARSVITRNITLIR